MIEKKNFYINGSWVAPKNQKDIQVINPATEKTCAVISLGGKEDINDAVIAAKQAFNGAKRDRNYRKAASDYLKPENFEYYTKDCN